MSRRQSDETTGRLRPGKTQDGGHASFNATHVRSSVSFLNPDTSGGGNLERAPSLNRLHAQSSTETSGLGETITSGFSSQESVLSYLGDERERSGSGISPGRRSYGSSAVVEHELLNKGQGPEIHSGFSRQHISKERRQQDSYLHTPEFAQRQDTRDYSTRQDEDRTGKYDSSSRKDFQTVGHREKTIRDTGGRSLTPQQAKEEYQDRQRRLKQVQRERDAAIYSNTVLLDKSRPSASLYSLDKQIRPSSVHRYKHTDSIELSNLKEQNSKINTSESRRRIDSSGSNRDTGESVSRNNRQNSKDDHQSSRSDRQSSREDRQSSRGDRQSSRDDRHSSKEDRQGSKDDRQSSRGDRPASSGERLNRASIVVEKSESSNREAVGNIALSRERGKTTSKEGIDISSDVPSVSSSKESVFRSEVVSNNRGKRSSDVSSGAGEKRSSSNTREQLKSQSSSSRTNSDEYNDSSSSRKSAETQILNIKSSKSRSHSSSEFIAGSSKGQTVDASHRDSIQARSESQRKQHPGGADVRKSLPKLTEAQRDSDNVSKISLRNLNEGSNSKGYSHDPYVSTKENIYQVRGEPRSSYSRQKSEPLEHARDGKEPREYERSKSWDTQKINEKSGANNEQNLRQMRQKRGDTQITESERGSVSRKARLGARDAAGLVSVSDSIDIEVGPILIRRSDLSLHDINPGDTREREKRAREVSGRESRQDKEYATKDRRDNNDKPHNQAKLSTSHTKQLPSSKAQELVRGDFVQDRQHPRVSAIETLSTRDVDYDTVDRDTRMNYERLFHEASRGVNGIGGGGGGSKQHQNSLDGGYSSPPVTRVGGSIFGQNYNSMSRNINTREPRHMSASADAVTISTPGGQDMPAIQSTVASSTKSPALCPIPTVQLTSPDDPRLNIETIDKEWERRESRSSNRSRNSIGSNRFLGVNTGSAWAKWSRERRASYRRRLERMELAEGKTTTDVTRVSTPIKKARQEGLKFIHPDLEATYLSEDDLNELRRHKQQQVHAMRVIEKRGRHKYRMKNEVKLTAEEWHMLQEFWSHAIFVRARLVGILLSLVALIFMVVSVTNHSWLKQTTWNLTIVEGLWINCTQSTVIANSPQECSTSNGRNLTGGSLLKQTHSEYRGNTYGGNGTQLRAS